MTPPIARYRAEGMRQLRLWRELSAPNRRRTYAVKRALNNARYAFECAARAVLVDREKEAAL